MERQTKETASFPPFIQQLIDHAKLEALRDGKLEGLRDGKLEGLREALLRLIARAELAMTEGDRDRIQTCADAATLDRWIENILGAKTIADVLC